ncbi:hypothetical protein CFOL_v3_07788 [Cephalotus follicularis]|uniref:Uncharacterized protein n=1 Tax=Cephalotus follicularis TaxID=3775 RepID=A0A1Q3B8H7_CEPFO|nr:hypothetical protein CFOL_v3_07788 [Cephalotus follicularis]
MSSIQSNGFVTPYTFSYPNATNSLSATNSMYWAINVQFIPTKATGSASQTNSLSISTASFTIPLTRSSLSLLLNREYIRHAKSQCKPSSRDTNSLEKVSPGMRPRFFSQNMEQKLPEKKIPSTQAKATILSAKVSELLIHLMAQSAFLATHGTVSMAWKRRRRRRGCER